VTVYMVIFMPNTPYIRSMYLVLANPTVTTHVELSRAQAHNIQCLLVNQNRYYTCNGCQGHRRTTYNAGPALCSPTSIKCVCGLQVEDI
jgi:hypothetical protein